MRNVYLTALPRVKEGAHIGILGGSFDPPHLCHELLALSFLALEPIDELWIVPCANHAFKSKLSDFSHRFAMCEIAFSRLNQIRVLDIENTMPSPSYTIQTLNFILEKRPDLSIAFGLGSDLVSSFDKWHQASEIAKKASIVIFERESYPIGNLPTILSSARIHDGYRLPDMNSTTLRNFFQKNQGTSPFLDRDVMRYIAEHRLYRC